MIGLDWSLKRPVCQERECRRGDFGVVAGLQDDVAAWVDFSGGAEARADRFEHRQSRDCFPCDGTDGRRARRRRHRLRGRGRRPSRRKSGEWHRTRRRRAASRRRQSATSLSCFVPPMRPPRPAARITPMRVDERHIFRMRSEKICSHSLNVWLDTEFNTPIRAIDRRDD